MSRTSRAAPWLQGCYLLVVTGMIYSASNFSLSNNSGVQSCRFDDDREGECLPYYMCSDEHTILVNGEIDDEELRSRKCPPKQWCCIYPNRTAGSETDDLPENTTNKTVETTSPLESDGSCPWCVSLYRDGGHPRTKSPSGLYCGGALITGRVVLTAGTCLVSARDQTVTVGWLNGDKDTVQKQYLHPQYNSGTHEYDLGLLLLAGDKLRSFADVLPAPAPAPRSACTAPGWGPDTDRNYYDPPIQNIVSSLKAGGCGVETAEGALCTNLEGDCSLSVGSPLICGNQIAGIVSGRGCFGKRGVAAWRSGGDWLHLGLQELGRT